MAVQAPRVSAQSPSRARIMRMRRRSLVWQPIIVLAALIGFWYLEAAHYAHRNLSFVVPYPHLVWTEGFGDGSARQQIISALGHSAEVTFVGLAIAIVIGTVWAMIMVQAKWAERGLYPYAVVLQCVPILALVPLISALEGDGFKARVVVTVLIALFPIITNTLFGLQSTERGQRELFKLSGAGRLTLLRRLQLPAALPSIFVGLRTAAGLAVVGAIVGDQFFQRGTPGLGVLIEVDESRLLGPQAFAAILTAALFGVAVFLAFGLLARLAVGKWYEFS